MPLIHKLRDLSRIFVPLVYFYYTDQLFLLKSTYFGSAISRRCDGTRVIKQSHVTVRYIGLVIYYLEFFGIRDSFEDFSENLCTEKKHMIQLQMQS
jgi:hypothetical protein